jgi:hypothetical protein
LAEGNRQIFFGRLRRPPHQLDGRVACKLTADNHGRTEWWLLLDPVAS